MTVAVTQALYRTEELREYLGRALDDGVTREEISGLMTHVAMYAGWPSASNASRVATDVYERRGLAFPPPVEPVDLRIDLRGGNPGYPAIPYLSALTRSLLYDEVDGILLGRSIAASLVRDAGFDAVIVGPLARASEFDRGSPLWVTGMPAREIREALNIR